MEAALEPDEKISHIYIFYSLAATMITTFFFFVESSDEQLSVVTYMRKETEYHSLPLSVSFFLSIIILFAIVATKLVNTTQDFFSISNPTFTYCIIGAVVLQLLPKSASYLAQFFIAEDYIEYFDIMSHKLVASGQALSIFLMQYSLSRIDKSNQIFPTNGVVMCAVASILNYTGLALLITQNSALHNNRITYTGAAFAWMAIPLYSIHFYMFYKWLILLIFNPNKISTLYTKPTFRYLSLIIVVLFVPSFIQSIFRLFVVLVSSLIAKNNEMTYTMILTYTYTIISSSLYGILGLALVTISSPFYIHDPNDHNNIQNNNNDLARDNDEESSFDGLDIMNYTSLSLVHVQELGETRDERSHTAFNEASTDIPHFQYDRTRSINIDDEEDIDDDDDDVSDDNISITAICGHHDCWIFGQLNNQEPHMCVCIQSKAKYIGTN